MVVEPPGGGTGGARYVPLELIVPWTESPPGVPFTSQVVTAGLAVKTCTPPALMASAAGLITTPWADTILIAVVPVMTEVPVEVAVTVTVEEGMVAGAV